MGAAVSQSNAGLATEEEVISCRIISGGVEQSEDASCIVTCNKPTETNDEIFRPSSLHEQQDNYIQSTTLETAHEDEALSEAMCQSPQQLSRAQRRSRTNARLRAIQEAKRQECLDTNSDGAVANVRVTEIRRVCDEVEHGDHITQKGVQVIAKIIDLMRPFLAKGVEVRMETVVRQVARAYQVGSLSFGSEDAARWGGQLRTDGTGRDPP